MINGDRFVAGGQFLPRRYIKKSPGGREGQLTGQGSKPRAALQPKHISPLDTKFQPLGSRIEKQVLQLLKAVVDMLAGVFRRICELRKVPVQDFYNHSSNPGGGTLGLISGAQVSFPTVDIGLPQLAMHSPYETAGKADITHMVNAMKAFYEAVPVWGKDGACKLV